MPRAIEILGGTSIAATSWKIGDRAHISLFAQYNDGGIRESRWDEEAGWTGGKTPDDIIIQSTYHSTKLAAININNGKKVCVYYTWSDSISGTTFLGEICQDDGGSWYSGELSKAGVVVASNSGIAACGPVMGERDITVLYYRPDYYMCEAVFSKGAWSQRAIVDVSYNIKNNSGSYLDISAIVCPRPPGDIIQASYINNSNYGALISTNPNGTWWTYSGGGYGLVTGEDPVRGAVVYNGQGSLNPKIYSMKSGDDLVMEWTGTPNPLGGISWTSATVQNCYPLAGVAVVGAFVKATDPERAPIRLYYQDKETNQVKQRRWLEGYKTWAEVDVDHDIVPTGTVVT